MAFLAQLTALTEQLVSLITAGQPSEGSASRSLTLREAALRNLRHHSFPRTNQFQVEDQLRGLNERFRVHSRDKLADALQASLDKLTQCANNFTPDVLNFLLELSDQPTQKTRLADLEKLQQPDADDGPRLTWEEIAREDGWADDRQLWRNVSFEDSSAEDYSDVDHSDSAGSADDDTTPSRADSKRRTVRDIVIGAKPVSQLERVRSDQAWRAASPPAGSLDDESKRTPVSDMQVIREVLFMLSGLPTTLFRPDSQLQPGYRVAHVPAAVSESLLSTFASCGKELVPLRKFAQSQPDVALIRAFQDATRRRLEAFDQGLAELQAVYISGTEDVVVSLGSVVEDVLHRSESMRRLAAIITSWRNDRDGYNPPFRYLELLFKAATAAQAVGQDAVYRFLGGIFFDCFEFYLRPLRAWMEEGRILINDPAFFVRAAAEQVPLGRLWQDQYSLVQDDNGVLHAPSFLHPAAKRIFATGKSVVILQRLGRYDAERRVRTEQEAPLTFDGVCPQDHGFAPFPELFRGAFENWVDSKHHGASSTLRQVLFEACKLSAHLDALQQIYFMSNGAASSDLKTVLFQQAALFGQSGHLDLVSRDRFTLADLAQEAFAHLRDADRISARIEVEEELSGSTTARPDSVRAYLPLVHIGYRLPWYAQLIVQEQTLGAYKSVFTFLLQISAAAQSLKAYKTLNDIDAWNDELRRFWLVRSKLLWFTSTVYGYLTSDVLIPAMQALHASLAEAIDVDQMIEVHNAFTRRVMSEGCLDPKLGPIRECMLDVLDLASRLERSRAADAAGEMSSHGDDSVADPAGQAGARRASPRPVFQLTQEIHGQLEKHLWFVCNGLRAVARAKSDRASAKWDLLAEVLENGLVQRRQVSLS